ncbi:MAG TPA: LysM peptidoglycan-binding domain-containing protein [Thermoclostridium caenicola]|uniref:Serine/threonine protein phosphatase PrpC n=1 Tax=Thermoclostridium caenicola TaxID=659425 RepID=A0A1M6GCJ0_9FIRM|nr:LysM peptidoglycan-binding domain-containing protein [Thermoclostridium caenicola]SHJ07632.1 Serine/threonine protein phosphatase PrpC [Thermoclostridium caenicola]HOK42459.1 LysM peptidoglycan-binding domain-containing protein [Thermoclostridium caenicola]HOL85308.1 LysM peptidoglycan-binding domain-containing protein [Thermoclostridium caenicola]HPO76717.1 LysM peptidoglycan-binding domain-containing protein [Thermoclostridium caenicola]
MSSVIKINACVYSRKGYGRESNTNSFYMNGKFTSEQHIDNVQASMENRGTEYLFSIADNMNGADEDNDTQIAIIDELRRYHEKITVNGGDLKFKVKELEAQITDISRLLTSFLEMNRVPAEDPRWGIGFGSLLVSDGQFVAATAGNCKVFMMRDGMFRPLAGETSRAKRMLDALIQPGESVEDEEITLPDENPESPVVISDIYEVTEGDCFLLCSDGLVKALGEEKIEDILSLRSDSTYIAYKLVDEAMKRTTFGDLTAMVVQVERRYEGTAIARKTTTRTSQVKNRVERLNRAPAVTYKYNRKRGGRYQGALYGVLLVVTVLILFGIIGIMIKSMIDPGKEPARSPSASATATPTPTPSATPDLSTPDPADEPTFGETPTPTPEFEIKIHKVAAGDTISKIAQTYYGSTQYGPKLCEYNGITDPNKIMIGQEIKIPPKELLP